MTFSELAYSLKMIDKYKSYKEKKGKTDIFFLSI